MEWFSILVLLSLYSFDLDLFEQVGSLEDVLKKMEVQDLIPDLFYVYYIQYMESDHPSFFRLRWVRKTQAGRIWYSFHLVKAILNTFKTWWKYEADRQCARFFRLSIWQHKKNAITFTCTRNSWILIWDGRYRIYVIWSELPPFVLTNFRWDSHLLPPKKVK